MHTLPNQTLSSILLVVCSIVSATSSFAEENLITDELYINGNKNGFILSPYSLQPRDDNPNKNMYVLYDIDYTDLNRQIAIYKRIYFTGQLLHGALMIKMKPKFTD